MNRDSWILICLAYIIGLLATGLFYFSTDTFSWLILLEIGVMLVFLGIVIKFVSNSNLDNQVWLSAIVIAILAVGYFSFRIPQPSENDISYLVTSEKSQIVTVTGKVLTEPRLNSSHKIKFWLQAEEVNEKEHTTTQTVSGKLYVTVPLLQGHNIYPRQLLTIEGVLYKPNSPNNTIQFNFKKYLRDRGAFAGLTGFKIINRSEKIIWGWYRLRTRIIRAQVQGLGSPLGQLVSSMVLGRRAVDLPEDLRNLFIKSGLAHVLAASGFHVSLLLGIILKLSNFLDEKKQLIIGVITLLIYVCLTGFAPSVIRATIMGLAVLVAIASQAKVRPLGSLLLAAILILLINPLLIWDLGFQLSFLATLGLIITLPVLETKLDWLPSNIAIAIAVPLAASIWTLPLICYVFNTVATYSIIVNLIATPLITFVSLGGMLSSAIALMIPSLGSYLAGLVKYPILLLVTLTKFFTNLPGSTFAIGTISLWLLLVIYGLIVLAFLNKKYQKKWWLILILIISLIILPLHYQQHNLLQFTVLDTSKQPTLLIQDRGKVILINSGESQAVRYTILPFLASQGINQVDYLILFPPSTKNYQQSLSILQSQIVIKKLAIYGNYTSSNLINKINIPWEFNSSITTNSVDINTVENSKALQLKINNQQWLITDQLSSLKKIQSQQPSVLLWFGKNLNYEAIKNFNGKIAIANNFKSLPTNPNKSLKIYPTDRHGTIIWTPDTGFLPATEIAKRNNTLW